jgi:uncharacterized protein DUF5993
VLTSSRAVSKYFFRSKAVLPSLRYPGLADLLENFGRSEVAPGPRDEEVRMDMIIFILMLVTLIVMSTSNKKRALILFWISFLAMMLLFNHHVTAKLKLSF